MSYAAPIKTYRKTPVERRMLYLDYSCWLEEGEMLSDFQVTVSPYTEDAPITVTTGYTNADQNKLGVFIGGGVANTNYVLKMVVRTSIGQVKQDNIGVQVGPS